MLWATEASAKAGTHTVADKLAKALDGLLWAAPPAGSTAGRNDFIKLDSSAAGQQGGDLAAPAVACHEGAVDAKRVALKPLVRRTGIPVELRPALWLLLSGGLSLKQAASAGAYAQAAVPLPGALSGDAVYAVEEEVRAAVRSHPYFTRRQGQAALRRLLVATACRNPRCLGAHTRPGLGCIAAFVLVVIGFDKEEDAFWTLTALLEGRVFQGCSGQVALGIHVEQRVLDKLVQKKLPKVYEHCLSSDFKLSGLTQTWLSSLFTTVLTPETIARIWDCYICEGPKVLHRVALALLKKYETTILSCFDICQLRKVVEARLLREQDADALLTIAFKGIGALTSSSIAHLRVASMSEVEQHYLEHQRKLDFIICGTREGHRLTVDAARNNLQQVV